MSDWLVHLIEVGGIGKHPNADSLEITQVYGQNVLCRSGIFKTGDLAVFIPPDSVMPDDPNHPLIKDNPKLKPRGRVDAVRLRGIFSNGFMVPARELFTEEELKDIPVGTHVAERLGVTKYEDEGEKLAVSSENEKDPGYMPCYTDIEGWAKYRNKGIINPGDQVVLTEKIHGANARFTFRDGRLWVGSRTCVKAQYVVEDRERNLWWAVAKELNLEEKLQLLASFSIMPDSGLIPSDMVSCEDTVIYGEVYGQVQDLKYGVNKGASLRIFDAYSPKLGRYHHWDIVLKMARIMELETVPELYRGPWSPELEELRNGPSALYPGHIREGFVVKPLVERWNEFTNRTIFKFVGEDYKTRKKK